MEFKTYIKKLRSKLGISQEEASKRIDVSISTIQNWERGDNKPDMNSISNIAKVYNVKPGDIIKVLARELDKEYLSDNICSNNKKEEYIDVMPSGLDYSSVEGLEFTSEEQELFIILALSMKCSGDAIPLMYEKIGDYLSIAMFLDKLNRYKLISLELSKLSDKGNFVFENIKSSRGILFDIYSIEFKEFIKACELYGIVENLSAKIDILKEMIEAEDYYLNTFEQDRWDKGKYNQRYIESDIKIPDRYADKSRISVLQEYLDSDYYKIVHVECDEESYVAEKESYFKKLEFYENHKDLNDGLIEPTKYQERIYMKAVPTEKAIKFMKYLNE